MAEDFPGDPTKNDPNIIDFNTAKEKMKKKVPPKEGAEPTFDEVFESLNQSIKQDLREAYENLEKNPNDLNAIIDFGVACSHGNVYEIAEQYLKKALDINPNLPEVCFELALMYNVMENRTEDAIKYFRMGLKLKPDSEYCLYLAEHIQETEPMEAIALLRRFLALPTPTSFFSDDEKRFYLGNKEDARRYLKELQDKLRIK